MPRVLLIEDDPDAGEAIKAMLEVGGHTVIWTQHGKMALSFLNEGGAVDLILTDILMPEMDGIESIRHFRLSHPSIPLVAMTGQRATPYLRAASLFGAKATLQKPFTVPELEQVIQQALKKSDL